LEGSYFPALSAVDPLVDAAEAINSGILFRLAHYFIMDDFEHGA